MMSRHALGALRIKMCIHQLAVVNAVGASWCWCYPFPVHVWMCPEILIIIGIIL